MWVIREISLSGEVMDGNLKGLVQKVRQGHKRQSEELAMNLFNNIDIEKLITETIAKTDEVIDLDMLFDIGFNVEGYSPDYKVANGSLTLNMLKQKAKALGLSDEGSKQQLITRLNKSHNINFWRKYLRPKNEVLFGHETWGDVITHLLEYIEDGGLRATSYTQFPRNWKNGTTYKPHLIAINSLTNYDMQRKESEQHSANFLLNDTEIFALKTEKVWVNENDRYEMEHTAFEISNSLVNGVSSWVAGNSKVGYPNFHCDLVRHDVIVGIRIDLREYEIDEDDSKPQDQSGF